MKKTVLSLLAFILVNNLVWGQDNTYHKPWSKEDSAAINALVMYPDTIRLDIFTACEYPGAIVNIASLQKNSASEFQDLIKNYSKDEQEDFWTPLNWTRTEVQSTVYNMAIPARLRPGVSLKQAQAEMDTLAAQQRAKIRGPIEISARWCNR